MIIIFYLKWRIQNGDGQASKEKEETEIGFC
jgi:hypothetical protein